MSELSEKLRPSGCKVLKPYEDNMCPAMVPKAFCNGTEYAIHLWKKSGIDLGVYR